MARMSRFLCSSAGVLAVSVVLVAQSPVPPANDAPNPYETIEGWDEDDTAYKFFAGYRLNSFLAFELDYVNQAPPGGRKVSGSQFGALTRSSCSSVRPSMTLGRRS